MKLIAYSVYGVYKFESTVLAVDISASWSMEGWHAANEHGLCTGYVSLSHKPCLHAVL